MTPTTSDALPVDLTPENTTAGTPGAENRILFIGDAGLDLVRHQIDVVNAWLAIDVLAILAGHFDGLTEDRLWDEVRTRLGWSEAERPRYTLDALVDASLIFTVPGENGKQRYRLDRTAYASFVAGLSAVVGGTR